MYEMHNLLLKSMLRLLFLGSGRQAACGPKIVLDLVVLSHVIVYDLDERSGQEESVQLARMRFGWAEVWAVEPQKFAVGTGHPKVWIKSPVDRL